MLGERSLNCLEMRVAPGGLVVGMISISLLDAVDDVTIGIIPKPPPPSPPNVPPETLLDVVVRPIPKELILRPLAGLVQCFTMLLLLLLLLLLLTFDTVLVTMEALGFNLMVFDRDEMKVYGDDGVAVDPVDVVIGAVGEIETADKDTSGRASGPVVLEVDGNTGDMVELLLVRDIGCTMAEAVEQ